MHLIKNHCSKKYKPSSYIGHIQEKVHVIEKGKCINFDYEPCMVFVKMQLIRFRFVFINYIFL